jgi:hypothetical protein
MSVTVSVAAHTKLKFGKKFFYFLFNTNLQEQTDNS